MLTQRILRIIEENPGMSGERLSELFQLSSYRLHRVFRHIERDLSGRTLVHSQEHGVWIVGVDPAQCTATEWAGPSKRGYRQCLNSPEFNDGRCYEHSQCENPEMIAFARRVAYLTGPGRPSAMTFSQLGLTLVEELVAALAPLDPWTRKDYANKRRLLTMLAAAQRVLEQRLRMRGERGQGLPPEFERRHRASSINPFEFSLKKHFAVLEVSSDATRAEVVRAWRHLARIHHPDREGGDEDKMKAINLAKDRIFRIRRWD
ncbi:MAG: hypothetical protein FJ118_11665 [Deltaproteobacteria bacterium]|nr:hypothetical protein [Deltaproteobacteria bacterium]